MRIKFCVATALALAMAVPASGQGISPAGDQSGIVIWENFFRQLVSALKIDTAQTSTSAQQVSATTKASSEAKISSFLKNREALTVAKIKQRYAYETGQGYNACMITVGLADIAKAKDERKQFASRVGNRDSEWLSQGGGRAEDTVSSMIALRKEIYCSDQEKDDLGTYCETRGNGYDGGNSDASVWLAQRGYGGEEAMTGFDFIDTVAPLPTVPERSPNSAAVALQRASAIRAGVLRNGARTTLQNIILDGMAGTSAQE